MQGDRERTGNSERTTTTTAQERDSHAPLGSYGGCCQWHPAGCVCRGRRGRDSDGDATRANHAGGPPGNAFVRGPQNSGAGQRGGRGALSRCDEGLCCYVEQDLMAWGRALGRAIGSASLWYGGGMQICHGAVMPLG